MNPHPAIFYHMRKEIRRIFTESIDAGVTGITVTAAKACPHPDTACFSIHFAKHCTTMTEENNLYSLGCHIQHKHCFFYAFTWFASTYHRNNSLPHLLWPTPPTSHALRKKKHLPRERTDRRPILPLLLNSSVLLLWCSAETNDVFGTKSHSRRLNFHNFAITIREPVESSQIPPRTISLILLCSRFLVFLLIITCDLRLDETHALKNNRLVQNF